MKRTVTINLLPKHARAFTYCKTQRTAHGVCTKCCLWPCCCAIQPEHKEVSFTDFNAMLLALCGQLR